MKIMAWSWAIFTAASVGILPSAATGAAERCDCTPAQLSGICKAELKVEPTVVRILSNSKQCSLITWKVNGTPRTTTVVDGANFEPMLTANTKVELASCSICLDRSVMQSASGPDASAPGDVATIDPSKIAEQLKREAISKAATPTAAPSSTEWETLIANAEVGKKEWDEQQRILALQREAEAAERRAREIEEAALEAERRAEREARDQERQRRQAEEDGDFALFALNAIAGAVAQGTREAREFNENAQGIVDQAARDQRAYNEAQNAREEARRAREQVAQAQDAAQRAAAENRARMAEAQVARAATQQQVAAANAARMGNVTTSGSVIGTGNGTTGSLASPPSDSVPQTGQQSANLTPPPIPSRNSKFFYDCFAVSLKRGSNGGDAWDTAYYGIVTSSRQDIDGAENLFRRHTGTSVGADGENKRVDCSPHGTRAEAQNGTQRRVNGMRKGPWRVVTDIDLSM